MSVCIAVYSNNNTHTLVGTTHGNLLVNVHNHDDCTCQSSFTHTSLSLSHTHTRTLTSPLPHCPSKFRQQGSSMRDRVWLLMAVDPSVVK